MNLNREQPVGGVCVLADRCVSRLLLPPDAKQKKATKISLQCLAAGLTALLSVVTNFI